MCLPPNLVSWSPGLNRLILTSESPRSCQVMRNHRIILFLPKYNVSEDHRVKGAAQYFQGSPLPSTSVASPSEQLVEVKVSGGCRVRPGK